MLNQSLFSLFLILKKLTIQFHKRITHILLTFALTFSTYSFAQVPQCELMPLSIPSDAVNNATVGGSVNNLQLKVGKGNFSWLSWSGVTDSPTLAISLILPGDSYNYNASDGELNIGDWAQGSPGIESSDAVHAAMAQLLGQEIFVPIYDETTGSGSSFDYKVSNFAKIILTDYELSANGWISFTFNGFKNCYNEAPVAIDATYQTNEDVPVITIIEASDEDGDQLNYTITQAPLFGMLSGEAPNLTYTPNTNFSGVDSFAYIANDSEEDSNLATVTVTVNSVNDQPTANNQTLTLNEDTLINLILLGDDIENSVLTYSVTKAPMFGVLTGNPPNIQYKPNPNFNGLDKFNFTVSDGELVSKIAEVVINVLPINDAPEAQNVSVITEQEQPIIINFNGYDIDGDNLTYTLVDPPLNGSITEVNQQILYTPNPEFFGDDSFTYKANDGVFDSNTAIITILVKELNKAPTISTSPILQATESELYTYQVEANDPNENDQLTFTLSTAPENTNISSGGLLQWTPSSEQVGHNLLHNNQCAIARELTQDVSTVSDIVTVVDESGSMSQEQAWVAELMPLLEAHLQSNKIGNSEQSNVYGLVGFSSRGTDPRQIDVSNSEFGDVLDFTEASKQLSTSGHGTEDGWAGIKFALEYPLREGSSRNMILVTDEDRDIVDDTITFESLKSELLENKVILNAVVNAFFTCEDGTEALGLGQNGLGYVADGSGGFYVCENVTTTIKTTQSGAYNVTTKEDYVDLALATGGAAWDLKYLRDGGANAESFSRAFIAIKVQEIKKQFEAIPQADATISHLSLVNNQITIKLKNTGLLDVTEALDVSLYDGAEPFTLINVDGLLSGEEKTVVHTLAQPITGQLSANVTIPQSVAECSYLNNTLSTSHFNIQVTDEGGLTDSQTFALSVNAQNKAPEVQSEPYIIAPVNSSFTYQVIAEEQNAGDGLLYELFNAPIGMTIDPLSGVIQFNPNISQTGQHQATVKVTDLGGLSHSQTFNITVDDSYIVPAFTSEPIIRAVEGQEYVYQSQVTKDPIATLSYQLFFGPEGMVIDAETGEVNWPVPDVVKNQEFIVAIQVSDDSENYDVQAFTLVGDIPPSAPWFYPRTFTSAAEDSRALYTAIAIDANVIESLTYELVDGPVGAKIVNTETGGLEFNPAKATHLARSYGVESMCSANDSPLRNLELKTKWDQRGANISQPLVGPLYDSNQDGKLDNSDITVIIGVTTDKYVIALDAKTGKEIWRRTDLLANKYQVGALINLDGDTNAEFIFIQESGHLVALNSDGSTRWISEERAVDTTGLSNYQYNAVYPTDLDGDGSYELLFGSSVFNAEGELLWQFSATADTYTYAARGQSYAIDFDLDGTKEVVYYDEVRDWQGNLLRKIPSHSQYPTTTRYSYFASGNFDDDAEPELVISESNSYGHWVRLIDNDNSILWEKKATHSGVLNLADFNNDGNLEIYSASNDMLLDGDGNVIWNTKYNSAHAGATVADVDADGYLDILRYRTGYLYIYEGYTRLFSKKIPLSTHHNYTPQSAPIFIDVDNDNSGEIVVGGYQTSVFEKEGGNWLGASANYSYMQQSIGDVTPDLRLNNTNSQGYGQTGLKASVETDSGRLSDLVIGAITAEYVHNNSTIKVGISNNGTDHIAAGSIIELYRDDPTVPSNKIGEMLFPEVLIGKALTKTFLIDNPELLGKELFAVAKAAEGTQECITDNNIISAHMVKLSVTDSDGLSDTAYWGLGVHEVRAAPIFTSSAVREGTVGELYQYKAQAYDPNPNQKVRYLFTQAPYGASIDTITGQLNWTPSNTQVGSNKFTVRAVDSTINSRYQTFYVNVTSASSNTAPVINSTAIVNAFAGFEYSYRVKATDAEGDYLTYSLISAPAGMNINSLSGEVSWLVTNGDIGNVDVVVNVSDESGLTAEQAFTLNITLNSAPSINSTPQHTIVKGSTYLYDVEASDVDGGTLSYALIQAPTGMTIDENSGLVQWVTTAPNLGEHAVTVNVTDAFGAYAEQSFVINVLDGVAFNASPIITSAPNGNGIFNAQYSYQITATDTDGDSVNYLLNTAPSGMSINPISGLIEWTPSTSQSSSYDVVIRVEDGRGGYATQSFSVTVSDGSVINSLPVISSTPGFSAKVTYLYEYQVQANDADGDSLSYSLTTSLNDMTISDTGLISWIPSSTESVLVNVRVSDGKGYIEQGWNINVLDADAALSAAISVSAATVNIDEVVIIEVTPINAVAPVNIVATINGDTLTLDENNQAQVTATTIGQQTIEATVTDKYATVIVNGSFTVRDPNDTNAPEASFSSLIDGQIITAPIDIIATINDPNIVNWKLVYQAVGALPTEYVIIAQGTDNVTGQVIGTFDPTLLLNGQYTVILQATDTNQQVTHYSATVIVDGDLKVGHFSITFEDINIPMVGIPLRVTRTYDSRQKHKNLDFGYGWSVSYQDVKVEESRVPGTQWTLNTYQSGPLGYIPNYCIEADGDNVVSVTLPTGKVERFNTVASPQCTQVVPTLDVSLAYEAIGDNQSTLVALNNNSGRLAEDELLDTSTIALLNPSQYQLTTRAGFIYALNQDFGVSSITDPNGNTLTYSDTGIVHSSGKAISFVRDSENRISEMVNPKGQKIQFSYTEQGDLTSVTEADGAVTSFTYNTSHGLLDINDPLGRNVVKNIYDDTGRLIAQEDSAGNSTSFTHNLAGKQSIVTDRLGRITILYYDDEGNITSQVDPLGNTTSFTFDANANQLTKTDALGRVTSATYNSNNDQLTDVDALGNTVNYSYNTRGDILTVSDELGNIYTNTYDDYGNLLTITDPQDNQMGNNINAQGLPTLVQDGLGNSIAYTYDSDGNKLTETNALDNLTTYTYDANGNMLSQATTRTLADASTVTDTTTYEFDSRNRVIKTTDALGNTSTTEYDLMGNQSATVNALGHRTTYSYDEFNRLTQTTYADTSTSSKTYDLEGNVLTETDRLGRVSSFDYDALNRVTKTNFANGSTNQTEYDAAGQVIADIDGNGNRSEYSYDLAGRRIQTKGALGNIHQFSYDASGQLVSETDALGNTTTYTYDSLGRKTQTTFANSSTMQTGFDALSRRTSATDQASIVTQYAYDALGRLTSVTDVQGNVTRYTFDEAGNKLSQTDAEGRITTWTYDALGRVLTRTLPLGQVENFSYNAVGNMLTHTNFNGDVATYSYDVNNRISQISYDKDSSTESFTYDALGNRLSSTSSDGTWAYSVDNQNRLASETKPSGDVLTYTYDNNSNKTSLTVTYANDAGAIESSRTENSTYDALNRLSTVTDNDSNITTYAYDAVGSRSTITHSNTNITAYTYDDLNRLTQLQDKKADGTVYQQFDYTLDATGRRTAIAELNGRTSSYSFDNLYRLTTETITDTVNGNHSASYSFDKVGNRIQSIINGVTTAYSYDDNDRLTSQGGETYSYDNQGNTLSKTIDADVTTYTYNAKQKLTTASITEAGITTNASYQYNIDGIRIAKAENGNSTLYLVDSNRDYAQVIAEQNDSNQVNVEYVFGDDLLSQTRNNQTSTYQYDGQGSTRALTDSTGNVSDEYFYDVFGNKLASSGTTENSYLYTGEQFDTGLNQYYLRARYYNSNTGRFTQQDTYMGNKSDPISLHKYLYANSDPVTYIDPTGMFSFASVNVSMNIQTRLATVSVAGLSDFIGKVGVGLVAGGFGYGISDDLKDYMAKFAPKMHMLLEVHRIKSQSRVKRRARDRKVLYNYGSRSRVLSINKFQIGSSSLGYGSGRPPGFYATDIPPWDTSYTQEGLSALFYGGNKHVNVSWFIAFDGSSFIKYPGNSHEYYRPSLTGEIDLDVITIGPNLMLPK